jgi:hypothetical protein
MNKKIVLENVWKWLNIVIIPFGVITMLMVSFKFEPFWSRLADLTSQCFWLIVVVWWISYSLNNISKSEKKIKELKEEEEFDKDVVELNKMVKGVRK